MAPKRSTTTTASANPRRSARLAEAAGGAAATVVSLPNNTTTRAPRRRNPAQRPQTQTSQPQKPPPQRPVRNSPTTAVTNAAGSGKPASAAVKKSSRITIDPRKVAAAQKAREAAAASATSAAAGNTTPQAAANGKHSPPSSRSSPPAGQARIGTTICSISHEVDVQYGKKGAKTQRTLRGDLSIGAASGTLVQYYFSVYLYDEEAEEWEEIGYINSWRVDKKTAHFPDAQGSFRSLLIGNMDKYGGEEQSLHELALVMRSLFTQKSEPRKNAQRLREELGERGLIFLKLVHITADHQGQGLLQPMMALYRKLLPMLPEWCAFRDLLVLNPGRPQGEVGKAWEEVEDDDVVVDTLTKIYQRTDAYQYMVLGKVNGVEVPVMGRLVIDEENATAIGEVVEGGWATLKKALEEEEPEAREAQEQAEA